MASTVSAAPNHVLIDRDSGMRLAEQGADEAVEPASLTKLMTAYLVFDALHQKRLTLAQIVPIDKAVQAVEGSRMFLAAGQTVSVEQLIRGLLVHSGNDAALTLATAVAGSEIDFVKLMNQQATRLKLSKTQFQNATGLSQAGHHSSAADMASLGQAVLNDFPQYSGYFAEQSFRHSNITQVNRNPLLGKIAGVNGLKTGHTEAAGFCLVATQTLNGRRLIAAYLGAPSEAARASETARLLQTGMQDFEKVSLPPAPQKFPLRGGRDNAVIASLASDWVVSVKKAGNRPSMLYVPVADLQAPIAVGQVVGKANLMLDGRLIDSRPMLATKAVAELPWPLKWWSQLWK
jgi:serine-type D-Ala-D-Ala carboxypeptidase (penicillin-binding protein 5/6)